MNISKQILLLEKLLGKKVILESSSEFFTEEGEGQLSDKSLQIFSEFLDYCFNRLEIINIPEIRLVLKRTGEMSTGECSNNGTLVEVYTKNRHIVDVCRSVAHELKHVEQIQEDRMIVDKEDSATSPSEVEATVFAATIMRDFEKKHPEIYEE